MAMQYAMYPQYIPILKWQKNEQRALQHVYPDAAPRVLPCIEVRDSSQHKTLLSNLNSVWKAASLVDYSNPEGNLTPARLAELVDFLKLGTGSSVLASPVLSPYVTAKSLSTVAGLLGNRKITLRLRLDDPTKAGNHQYAIEKFMKTPGVGVHVDRLIVDLRITPNGNPSQAELNTFTHALHAMKGVGIPNLHLASGAFPASLQGIEGMHEIQRRDWELWQNAAAASPQTLIGYSDYGPLTPEWKEEVLTKRGGRSVIRYALEDRWRILRAASNTTDDSIAISELMTTTYAAGLKPRNYSFGDQLIHDRADPAVPDKDKKSGQYHITEYWSHHIAFVVKDQY